MSIEALLERHLAPVTAPRELWSRVANPAVPQSRQPVIRKLAWTFAAMLVFAGVVSSFRAPRAFAANEAAALQALARGTGDLEFRSTKAAEIRAWIRTGTGMDVPLPENPSSRVSLLGARMATTGTVEIAYNVDNQRAALVVSKAALSLADRHRHGKSPKENLQTYSWTLGGQQYTLACAAPGELQVACLLCHAPA